jgi:hypothetical protein
MDDPKDSPLRKAEESAKRVLERLGSAIDKKVLGRTGSQFGSDYAGELASRIEQSIEASLQPDDAGTAKVAPNHFKIGLTYEQASMLTSTQIEALSRDLKSAAHEFIHNRRYETRGPVEVEIAPDLFATSTAIKADFDPGSAPTATQTSARQQAGNVERAGGAGASRPSSTAVPRAMPEQLGLTLQTPDGRGYQVELATGGAPAYIGRAAGNTVRLDDPSVSRVHCSLALRGDGQLVISDLDSANGTFVNGRVVNTGEAQKLEFGDDIQIGDLALKISRLEA